MISSLRKVNKRMRAFEVYLNGKRLCVAGVGDGNLSTILTHLDPVGWNELSLHVGGLISPTNEHVIWVRRRLKPGDEVRVKIIDSKKSTAQKSDTKEIPSRN